MSNHQDMDTQRIAVGCLYLLSGKALVEFPGSTRAAPAPFAVVSMTFSGNAGGISPGYRHYFPFKVPWDLWQSNVVPVLSLLKSQGSLTSFMRDSSEQAKVTRIKAMLDGSLPGNIEEDNAVAAEGLEDTFDQLDPDQFWPDGTAKIVYPVVD